MGTIRKSARGRKKDRKKQTMLELRYRRRALLDLESIAIYLGEALGLPNVARQTIADIQKALERLCEFPDLGKPHSDSSLEGQGYKTYVVGNYRIVYTHNASELVVWRIFHVRQDIDEFTFVTF